MASFYPQESKSSSSYLLPYSPDQGAGGHYRATSEHSNTSSVYTPQTSSRQNSIQSASRTYTTLAQGPRASRPQSAQSISSIAAKFSLGVDPALWGSQVYTTTPEPDDVLHNVDPKRDRLNAKGSIFTKRGLLNLGCLVFTCLAIVGLFAGYPVASSITRTRLSFLGGFNIGGINATGQVPAMSNGRGVIDADTPESAKTIKSFNDDGAEYQLVFSDEFNTDGRSFYPGDDPYWEAVDLNYWQTGDLEWYDPEAVTTSGGALQLTLSKKQTHGLDYEGGMISTWNKFCFTGGLILASVRLPGANNIFGLWPAVWTMGNLGRAGYGASLEGMWPYSYDSCDVGTVANQSVNGLPAAALSNGDPYNDNLLSFLVGQRLSRCTCPGESHPGPIHSEDQSYVGRAACEIDMFEAQVSRAQGVGGVSQSGQWAPFDNAYLWANTSENQIIYDSTVTQHNDYQGGAYQEATSAFTTTILPLKTKTVTNKVEHSVSRLMDSSISPASYDDAYISWITNNKLAWTMNVGAVGPNSITQISQRPIPQEPMYIIANLGMSASFGGTPDFDDLVFPAIMSIDWIRVYQPKNALNIGCDPENFPTQAYINEYIDAYTNPNFTTWAENAGGSGYNQSFPKNKFLGQC
ncbi:beta-glucan synthesis-associated [Mycena floridula]|nr:beta-glucan synthesis-associated [Mycena floridula]